MHRISSRRKGKVVDFVESKPQYERGTVVIEGGIVNAIRFSSGIVHIIKTRRGVRVSKAIAKTFVPNEPTGE